MVIHRDASIRLVSPVSGACGVSDPRAMNLLTLVLLNADRQLRILENGAILQLLLQLRFEFAERQSSGLYPADQWECKCPIRIDGILPAEILLVKGSDHQDVLRTNNVVRRLSRLLGLEVAARQREQRD